MRGVNIERLVETFLTGGFDPRLDLLDRVAEFRDTPFGAGKTGLAFDCLSREGPHPLNRGRIRKLARKVTVVRQAQYTP